MTENRVDKAQGFRNKTGPVGRALRFLLGAWLIVLIIPYLRAANWASILAAVGISIGLLALYLLIHVWVSNYLTNLNQCLGAFLAWVPAVAVFILGGTHGQVGVLIFAGVSLVLASAFGDPGCEVMSIPGLIFKKHTHLVCIFFSPIDWLEAKILKYFKGSA
jgi:hypothetical protein